MTPVEKTTLLIISAVGVMAPHLAQMAPRLRLPVFEIDFIHIRGRPLKPAGMN